jgi:DNA sulfur modification protein DndC
LNWVENDSGAFSQPDAELLDELAVKYQTSSPLIMKLLDLELSLDGLSQRSGIFKKMGSILKQDWDELESILEQRNKMQNTNDYKKTMTSQLTFDGNLAQGKHKNIFEEASDKLTRENEYYGNILKQMEESR